MYFLMSHYKKIKINCVRELKLKNLQDTHVKLGAWASTNNSRVRYEPQPARYEAVIYQIFVVDLWVANKYNS